MESYIKAIDYLLCVCVFFVGEQQKPYWGIFVMLEEKGEYILSPVT